jgi:predicted nuclease with TOPRIM domain
MMTYSSSSSPIHAGTVRDYLLRPQYLTQDQKWIGNMEAQIGELAALMKELHAQNTSIKRTLNDNLSTLKDMDVWLSQINSKLDELHQSVLDLCLKVDQLSSQ